MATPTQISVVPMNKSRKLNWNRGMGQGMNGIVERFWAIGEGLTVPDFPAKPPLAVRVTAKGSRKVDFLIDPVLGGRYIWVKLTREPNCRRMACVPARDRLAGFFMRWGWAKSPRPVRAV